ncbi:MAG: response regulator [Longimicrobiales bacterium]
MAEVNARGRILLIEDDEDNLSVYQTILEHVGFAVSVARNAEDGIAIAREQHPVLVLMDISLPRMDGWQATRILKNDPHTRQIPVIALTAHALADDIARSRAAGCESHLAKPVEPRRVVEEVERVIAARG